MMSAVAIGTRKAFAVRIVQRNGTDLELGVRAYQKLRANNCLVTPMTPRNGETYVLFLLFPRIGSQEHGETVIS